MAGGLGSDQQDVMKQASHMWAMLDEMASSDPAAYNKFIKKTMDEGKNNIALPKPFTCIKTSLVGPTKSVLYINMCGWEHVPRPKTDADPIAVASGPMEKDKDTTGEYSVVRLAFNPSVLEEAFQNAVDRDLMINLGMEYAGNQHDIKVSRTYKECTGLKFKGDIMCLTSAMRFFGRREKTEEEIIAENLAGLSPDSLLGKIQELSGKDMDQSELESRFKDLAVGSGAKDGGSIPDGKATKKKKVGLIEEISSTKTELPAPKYKLNMLGGGDGGKQRRIELRIELDGVQTVAQCELDISEDEVNLYVEGKYELALPLPEPILESEAKAKFNKRSSVLVVTLLTQAMT